jgi:hypothetical protein
MMASSAWIASLRALLACIKRARVPDMMPQTLCCALHARPAPTPSEPGALHARMAPFRTPDRRRVPGYRLVGR